MVDAFETCIDLSKQNSPLSPELFPDRDGSNRIQLCLRPQGGASLRKGKGKEGREEGWQGSNVRCGGLGVDVRVKGFIFVASCHI